MLITRARVRTAAVLTGLVTFAACRSQPPAPRFKPTSALQTVRAAAPGLRFVGYTSRPGALGFMSRQAKRSAKAIAREVESRP